MNLTLHHINLSTDNVEKMDEFYRDVLGLGRAKDDLPVLEKNKGYSGGRGICFGWKNSNSLGAT